MNFASVITIIITHLGLETEVNGFALTQYPNETVWKDYRLFNICNISFHYIFQVETLLIHLNHFDWFN